MIKKVGGQSVISSDPDKVRSASKLILPGVGSFDWGMRSLQELGLVEAIREAVIEKKSQLLGICLGMQLITRSSEEGKESGLCLIDAETVKFSFDKDSSLKIPHMGWNTVEINKDTPGLLKNMYENPRFYFVHSYYVRCEDETDIMGTTEYGIKFASAIHKGNIYGTQFHPEKSHKFGMKIIENYIS